MAEELERQEADRKLQAEKIKNKMEVLLLMPFTHTFYYFQEDKKEQESGIVTMFERLKGENDVRKNEIHGLKDILVRENEKIQREQVIKLLSLTCSYISHQIAINNKLDTGLAELDEKLVSG